MANLTTFPRDGQRFLAAMTPEEEASEELTAVQNWMAGLEK
jgi:hypothetical protein